MKAVEIRRRPDDIFEVICEGQVHPFGPRIDGDNYNRAVREAKQSATVFAIALALEIRFTEKDY